MFLFAIIAMPLCVYFGWRKGEPIRRLKFLLIYGCVIFTMGLFQWATAPPTYLAEPPSQPTTEQVGTNFICICIALYGAWKLGGRLRDTSIKKTWVIPMAVFSPIGIPWLIALFYPSSSKRVVVVRHPKRRRSADI